MLKSLEMYPMDQPEKLPNVRDCYSTSKQKKAQATAILQKGSLGIADQIVAGDSYVQVDGSLSVKITVKLIEADSSEAKKRSNNQVDSKLNEAGNSQPQQDVGSTSNWYCH